MSTDHSYRGQLEKVLTTQGRQVVCGDDDGCLATLGDWGAEWRKLDVEAVVIDIGPDIISGLDALDAVRRRDARAFVIVLSRVFGALGSVRLGANLLLEGDVQPSAVVDALRRRASARRGRDRR